jgi:hypothetical protein
LTFSADQAVAAYDARIGRKGLVAARAASSKSRLNIAICLLSIPLCGNVRTQ